FRSSVFCTDLRAIPTAVLYALSLHDALPISFDGRRRHRPSPARNPAAATAAAAPPSLSGRAAGPARRNRPLRWLPRQARHRRRRSEEHTSELQSRENLVCRLLLEKKKEHDET